jgi:hypothetical protein
VRIGGLLPATLALLLLAGSASAAPMEPWITVKGSQLVDKSGEDIRLIGINRGGFEAPCQLGRSIFEGPDDPASIAAMKSWHINAVRLPLNETCWLGISGLDPRYSGAPYREAVKSYVQMLGQEGLYVILDLQVAAPAGTLAGELIPMPDEDHSPEFWRSVATEFSGNHGLLFDLFNEPEPEGDWGCWLNGCVVESEDVEQYQAAGMQQLVETIRATGARQPLMLGGTGRATYIGRWLENMPYDPDHALVASFHTYDYAPCLEWCYRELRELSLKVPVVAGEIGERDCADNYLPGFMRWADARDISYLAWTWNAGGEWGGCHGGPDLIENYEGEPTSYGIGYREHLKELWLVERAAAARRRRLTRQEKLRRRSRLRRTNATRRSPPVHAEAPAPGA